MRKKTLIWLVFVLLCALVLAGCSNEGVYDTKKAQKYQQKLISVLQQKQEVTVGDIFDFDFSKAYVFKDNYIDGEGFAKKYGFDIDIKDVPENNYEPVRRIVFVDGGGKLVYEFRYTMFEKIAAVEEGMIIYPDTIIECVEDEENKPEYMLFRFVARDSDYFCESRETTLDEHHPNGYGS